MRWLSRSWCKIFHSPQWDIECDTIASVYYCERCEFGWKEFDCDERPEIEVTA